MERLLVIFAILHVVLYFKVHHSKFRMQKSDQTTFSIENRDVLDSKFYREVASNLIAILKI